MFIRKSKKNQTLHFGYFQALSIEIPRYSLTLHER